MARFLRAASQVLLIMIASPALADEGASGLYPPGNLGFGAGVTPDPGFYLSTGVAHYDGDIRVFIDGGKIVLDAEARPYALGFAPFWFLRQRSWEGISGCRSARLTSSFGPMVW